MKCQYINMNGRVYIDWVNSSNKRKRIGIIQSNIQALNMGIWEGGEGEGVGGRVELEKGSK